MAIFGNEKSSTRTVVAGAALLTGLALAGCGAKETPAAPAAPPPATSHSPTVPKLSPGDLFLTYRAVYPEAMGSACSGSPAPADTACGKQITAISQSVDGIQAAIARSIPGREFPKIRDSADQVRKSINLLRTMNCYGLNGADKKPGKNEAELCGTFSRLTLVGWFSFETTVEQS
jgi:hypothetical protein